MAVALCACSGSFRAQNIEGQIIAAQYGIWRVQGIPQPTTGNSFNFVAAACSQIAGNKTFQAFQVGTPIEIFDADPNQNEAVTPSAVSATNQGCSITAAPVHTHNSFSLGSATAGLQEAINANTTTTGNTIVLTAEWYRHGGSSGIITSVQGTTALNLVDVTKAPYDWYAWNGSVYVKIALGGGSIPHTNDILAGFGDGSAVAVPELGTTPVAGSPNTAKIAWKEDLGLGLFDCRDTKYPGGGCLGTTPGLAMQALANDITCYQAMTGLRANVIFPPGTFPIGTAANPTLVFPTGAHYASSSPNPSGTTTTFQASYNGHLALHFETPVSATCSDGNTHTNTLTAGYYGGGIGVHGCAQGGCANLPGDTNNYPVGGQNQNAILIEDSGGEVDFLGAYENGGDGIDVAGQSTHVGTLWTASNMAWYYFGITQSGQTYNPATDGWHCNVELNSLDGTFTGPFETGGFLQTPGAEYGHVCAAFWGGGNTGMGALFSNRDEIGLVRGNFANGRMIGATGSRIDAPMGEGIISQGGGNSYTSIDNSSACSGFSSVPKGTVFGPYIATLGSGMTNGTYVVHAVNQTGDTTGSGATLTVTVSGGVATGITVSAAGSLYLATPTFTMSGTGGTPATIGATTYQHCDKLDEEGAQNSFVGIKNIHEAFFGTDNSTGDIWASGGNSDTFDRGTTGNFERVIGIVNEPKGIGSHQDLPDFAQPSGGPGISGPTLDFGSGNHFHSGDTTPTSWTGPFTVGYIMQDIWIMGGNANTTLPFAFWKTCSGHDVNLGTISGQMHFVVTQDNNLGNPFIFTEQCDSIFYDWQEIHWTALSSLPATKYIAAHDVAGSMAVRALPALSNMAISTAGSASSFTYCFVAVVWDSGGKQVNSPSCTAVTPPLSSVNPNITNVVLRQAVPNGWTRYQLIFQSTTDSAFTSLLGVINDVTAPTTNPQPATVTSFFVKSDLIVSTGPVVSTAWYGANMTGTYNFDPSNLPTATSWPGIPGQVKIDPTVSTGAIYYCTADDHWVKAPLTWATF